MTQSAPLIRIVAIGFSLMVATAVFLPMSAIAQPVWQVAAGGVSLDAGAATTGGFGGPCTVAPPAMVGLVAPFFGHDMGQTNTASCREVGSCVLTATGDVNIFIDGVGTSVLRIHWDGMSQVHHSCFVLRAYTGDALANLTATLGLTPVGVPNGTPVTVDYIWSQGSTNNYHPETAAPDDTSRVFGTSLGVNGTALFTDGDFDLVDVKGGLFRNNQTGSFAATAGAQFLMNTDFNTDVHFEDPGNPPPPGTVPQDDDELTSYLGELTLSLVAPPPPVPSNGEIDFSVDMGSDACMAPVLPANGNELFDPGDMYPMGGPALAAGGQDGVLDDGTIFGGLDPRPVVPGAPIADVCSGMTVPPTETTNFDTDGSDSLDAATITAISDAITGGGTFPIPMLPSACVRRAQFLLLSFDDDTASHVYDNGTCSAPAAAQSVTGRTHGSVGGGDEVVGAILVPFAGLQLALTYPAGREDDVHTSLAPNPPSNATITQQAADDDVDALDERAAAACPIWLFSVDHEADFGMDPAVIYRVTPAGPVPFLTEANIGLFAGTDLRDFEFGIRSDAAGAGVLTLLFTVAPDDPLTATNESGGLDPAMIYASDLNGTFAPFLAQPIPDHGFGPADGIDALTIVPQPLPFRLSDSDGDGSDDDMDCAPNDPTAFGIPTTIQDLNVSLANPTTITWTENIGSGTRYHIATGSIPSSGSINFPAGTCLQSVATSPATDIQPNPLKGTAWYYLVKSTNACGAGSWGSAQRETHPACP
jgi:hypothetical protein